MDLHDIWQENKRSILGCLLGFVVFWIGSGVIKSVWSTGRVSAKIAKARVTDDVFDSASLANARAEAKELKAVRTRLQRALEFIPGDDFELAGKGDPDLHLDRVSREIRTRLVARADEVGVDLAAKNLTWKPPVGRDQIRATLVGLAVMEQAVQRLLDAHEAVRSANVEALGLVSIDSFRFEPARRMRRRGDPAELVEEERVRFVFKSEEPVVMLFLEACRAQAPSLALSEFRMKAGTRAGEPLTVRGTFSALRVREQ